MTGVLRIKVFENSGTYTLNRSFFNGQPIFSFKFFFEIHVPFYPTADKNRCIYSVKFEFCFAMKD